LAKVICGRSTRTWAVSARRELLRVSMRGLSLPLFSFPRLSPGGRLYPPAFQLPVCGVKLLLSDCVFVISLSREPLSFLFHFSPPFSSFSPILTLNFPSQELALFKVRENARLIE